MLLNYVEGANHTPDVVNQKLKAYKAFYGALLVWERVQVAYPSLKWIRRSHSYSNLAVSSSVYLKKIPVMVEVSGRPIGGLTHWVLYVGSQKCVDPWVGKIVSTSVYPAKGYALYEKGKK
jgi:hypothetical protein